MNTRKRIERIQSGLAALPCPTCGQMRPSEAKAQSEAELRKEAEEILADLLPDFGNDRAAALAAMREAAPTLSEYLPANFCSMCGFLPRVEQPIQPPEQIRREAEEILAALLPDYGNDKAAALAAMREIAPTLSSYLPEAMQAF